MSSCYPLTFTGVPAVVLLEDEDSNMVSDWVDVLVTTRTKAGLWAVYARKWSEEYVRGRYVRKWFDIDRVTGIRTATQLVQAIRRCEVSLCVDIDPEHVTAKVSELDERMGLLLMDML